MWSTYDQWKTQVLDYFREWDEPNGYSIFFCSACEDCGWLDDNGHAIPCTECSTEPTLEDMEPQQ